MVGSRYVVAIPSLATSVCPFGRELEEAFELEAAAEAPWAVLDAPNGKIDEEEAAEPKRRAPAMLYKCV